MNFPIRKLSSIKEVYDESENSKCTNIKFSHPHKKLESSPFSNLIKDAIKLTKDAQLEFEKRNKIIGMRENKNIDIDLLPYD